MTSTWSAEMPRNRHKKCIDAYDRAAERAKRLKLQHDSSPEPPAMSSEDSTAMPSIIPDTAKEDGIESDESSELSESSEEPSDDSDDSDIDDDDDHDHRHSDENAHMEGSEEAVVNLRANRGKKPVMSLADQDMGEDIRPFLKDFLPKLKAANEELQAQKAAGTLRTVELEDKENSKSTGGEEGDGESGDQYIELNLGLGVLEAKDPNASDSSNSEDDEDGEDGKTGDKDILGKLMGREKAQQTASIEVVEEKTEIV